MIFFLLAFADITSNDVFGEITVNPAGVIRISGHARWEAYGHQRKDGKIVLVWTELVTGRQAIGVYDIQSDGTLYGTWNDNGKQRTEWIYRPSRPYGYGEQK